MKIPKREDFALIMMGFLATNYSDQYLSLREVAKKTGLSSLFMKHIALKLKEKNLIESKEGIGGGYKLTRSPKKITVGQILQAMSNHLISPSCVDSPCRIKKKNCLCSILWKDVNKKLFNYLNSKTLSEFSKVRT